MTWGHYGPNGSGPVKRGAQVAIDAWAAKSRLARGSTSMQTEHLMQIRATTGHPYLLSMLVRHRIRLWDRRSGCPCACWHGRYHTYNDGPVKR